MQKWLPASDALLYMIVTQLPSPLKAQAYRAETLYTGPFDDKVLNIKEFWGLYYFKYSHSFACPSKHAIPKDLSWFTSVKWFQPTIKVILPLFSCRLIPWHSYHLGRFFAFGRVFSGTVKTGQKVRIMGPNYEHGGKADLHIKAIQRTVLMMGKYICN